MVVPEKSVAVVIVAVRAIVVIRMATGLAIVLISAVVTVGRSCTVIVLVSTVSYAQRSNITSGSLLEGPGVPGDHWKCSLK